ncbi:hypothetical protein OK016_28235 [Vibrio chagasii]|nr:hypothetical protein [Vibrio chagasii]
MSHVLGLITYYGITLVTLLTFPILKTGEKASKIQALQGPIHPELNIAMDMVHWYENAIWRTMYAITLIQ